MAVQFEMIGKLSLPKETEKFKPFEEKEYASGWKNKTLSFNMISGDNRFMLRSKGGYFADGHGDVFVFSKDTYDESGNKTKGEAFRIPWKERLTHPRLVEVVGWKKFVVDLEEPRFRYELMNALNKVKDGDTLTEEEVVKFGASDVKGLETALTASGKKRKEFIAEADFIDFMYKVITSGKYANKKFKITGTYDMQYSEEKGIFYSSYVPQRVYLAEDSVEEMATANTVLFYGENSLVDNKEDKNKYYVNGYVQVYDNNRKENVFAPYTVTIHGAKDDSELEAKREEVVVKRFTVEDETVYEYGVVLNLLDGAQKTQIKYEDLTEEQQDSILLGELTLDDIRKELGSVYGDRVIENVFVKPARGYSKGREPSAYSLENLIIKPLANNNSADSEEVEDEDEDLFA